MLKPSIVNGGTTGAVLAIGLAQGIALTVVYTDRPHPDRDTERRIISARRSNRHERQAYSEALR